MWWQVVGLGLSVIVLIVVTGITLLGMAALADPVVIGRCRQCSHLLLDFHRSTGTGLCRRCRHSLPGTPHGAHFAPSKAGLHRLIRHGH